MTMHAQVLLGNVSALPEDVYVNNLYFAGVQYQQAATSAVGLYTSVIGVGQVDAVGEYLASYISRGVGACQVRVYETTDPEPRVPRWIEPFTLPPASNPGNMPGEVALCLSFSAEVESGDIAARMRGRIFAGPFNTRADAGGSNVESRPSSDLIRDLTGAGDGLIALAAADTGGWVVHSVTAAEDFPVVSGWVDNAWDTIRARGSRPTARSTFGG